MTDLNLNFQLKVSTSIFFFWYKLSGKARENLNIFLFETSWNFWDTKHSLAKDKDTQVWTLNFCQMSWVLLGKGTSQVNRYTPLCCVGLFFLALLLLEKEMELLWCDIFNFFPQKHHVLDKSMVMIVSMWAGEVAIEGKAG